MSQLRRVVIVGRMNVGKSTLFNRLSTDVKSMALDYAGVTRDFLKDVVTWKDRSFELIDTGGIDLRRSQDEIQEKVRLRALEQLQLADVILFMVDGTVGPLEEDREIAKHVHKLEKPSALVLNKCDVKSFYEYAPEFCKLGFKKHLEISAQHSIGTSLLLDFILDSLPISEIRDDEPQYKVALIGKPNVGKSSLMNALMKKDRSLVSEIAGTTREAISDELKLYQETIQLTDTAGVRRQRSVNEHIEELMVKSSLQAVRDADIVLLMIDGSEGKLAHQELRLASFVLENGKALAIIRNKSDLLNDDTERLWKEEVELYEHVLKNIEQIKISCKTGDGIGKILPLVREIWERYQTSISATELTMLFKDGLLTRPLFRNGQRLKVFSAKQVAIKPPTIRLNVNEAQWFEDSQKAFFENLLRKKYNFKSIPIKILPRKINPKN